MSDSLVSVKVGGQEVSIPSMTTSAEIRKAAKLDPGSVLAVYKDGRYMVVSGTVELKDGDRLIVSRPFVRELPQKFKVLSSKKQRKSGHIIKMIFPAAAFRSMQEAFAADESLTKESYALAICGIKADPKNKTYTYLIKSIHIPSSDELIERSSITVTPRAEFLERVLNMAQQKGTAILDIHTHIRSPSPSFSWIDLASGIDSGRFLKSVGLRFLMCVAGAQGFSIVEYDAEHDAMALPDKAYLQTLTTSGAKNSLVHKASPIGAERIKVGIVARDRFKPSIQERLDTLGIADIVYCDDGKDLKDNDAIKHCDVIVSASGDNRIKSALNDIALKYYIPVVILPEDDNAAPLAMVPTQTGCLECAQGETGRATLLPELITCCAGIDRPFCAIKPGPGQCPKCGEDGITGQGDHLRRGRTRTS